MGLVISILAFFILLSFLVLIHEWGHFFVARRSGVTVEEFGFGFPPHAKTLFTRKGTRFTINWIPFGGFVRLKGENALTDAERRAKGSFAGASIPARIAILLAGVFMNFVLAIAILTIGFSVGRWVPTYFSVDDMREAAASGEIQLAPGSVRIAGLREGGGAAEAGVPKDSAILAVDRKEVLIPDDVVRLQKDQQAVTYRVRDKAGETHDIRVNVSEGLTGVELQFAPEVSAPLRPVGRALILSLRESELMLTQTVRGIGQLFVSLVRQARVPDGITGPVGILVLTHDTVREGFMPYLRLVAMLSLSLAVLNVLPFPALDGGRLLFVILEMLHIPAPRRFEIATNAVGFVTLLLLILIVTYNDIIRLFLP